MELGLREAALPAQGPCHGWARTGVLGCQALPLCETGGCACQCCFHLLPVGPAWQGEPARDLECLFLGDTEPRQSGAIPGGLPGGGRLFQAQETQPHGSCLLQQMVPRWHVTPTDPAQSAASYTSLNPALAPVCCQWEPQLLTRADGGGVLVFQSRDVSCGSHDPLLLPAAPPPRSLSSFLPTIHLPLQSCK